MDISVTICSIDLKSSVCALKVLPEGIVSQILDLGPSFFYNKKRVTFSHFFRYKFLHFIKSKLGPESRF